MTNRLFVKIIMPIILLMMALGASFYFVVLLSSIFAIWPSLAFSKIEVPVNWVILYFLIVSVVNSERRFILFALLYLLVNFKMSQFGFLSFAKRGFTYTVWGVTGSPGWFRDSGDFGIQMGLFAPFVIGFILALRKYWGQQV